MFDQTRFPFNVDKGSFCWSFADGSSQDGGRGEGVEDRVEHGTHTVTAVHKHPRDEQVERKRDGAVEKPQPANDCFKIKIVQKNLHFLFMQMYLTFCY